MLSRTSNTTLTRITMGKTVAEWMDAIPSAWKAVFVIGMAIMSGAGGYSVMERQVRAPDLLDSLAVAAGQTKLLAESNHAATVANSARIEGLVASDSAIIRRFDAGFAQLRAYSLCLSLAQTDREKLQCSTKTGADQ